MKALVDADPTHAGVTGVPAGLLATTSTLGPDLRDSYAEIDVPMLAMHGTGDLMVDSAATAQLVELAGSDDKTLHLIPDGSHALLRDLDRDATLDTIMSWIEERIAGSDADAEVGPTSSERRAASARCSEQARRRPITPAARPRPQRLEKLGTGPRRTRWRPANHLRRDRPRRGPERRLAVPLGRELATRPAGRPRGLHRRRPRTLRCHRPPAAGRVKPRGYSFCQPGDHQAAPAPRVGRGRSSSMGCGRSTLTNACGPELAREGP
jgi:hypothetical protein